jgi:hypothetical protein
MGCPRTSENAYQVHTINTQWLPSVVLRMKCSVQQKVKQQQQLTVMHNGHMAVNWITYLY